MIFIIPVKSVEHAIMLRDAIKQLNIKAYIGDRGVVIETESPLTVVTTLINHKIVDNQ